METLRTDAVATRWRARDLLQESTVDNIRRLRMGWDGLGNREGFVDDAARSRFSALVRAYAVALRDTGVRLPEILPELHRVIGLAIRTTDATPAVSETIVRWGTEAYAGVASGPRLL